MIDYRTDCDLENIIKCYKWLVPVRFYPLPCHLTRSRENYSLSLVHLGAS